MNTAPTQRLILKFSTLSTVNGDSDDLVEDVMRQVESILKPWNGFSLDGGEIDVLRSIEELAQVGLFVLAVPEAHAGLGLPTAALARVARRLARYDLSIAALFVDHCTTLADWTRSESNEPDVADRFSAVVERGELALRGFALRGDHVRSVWDPDFKIDRSKLALGLRAFRQRVETDRTQLANEDVRLVAILLSACALGALESVHEKATEQAKLRVQFKKSIDRNTSVRRQLLEMRWKAATLERLLSCFLDETSSYDLDAVRTLSELAWRSAFFAADRCVQIFGGNGFMEDTHVPHWLRDVKTVSLFQPFPPDRTMQSSAKIVALWANANLPSDDPLIPAIDVLTSWRPEGLSQSLILSTALDDAVCALIHRLTEKTFDDPYGFDRAQVRTWFDRKIESYVRYVRSARGGAQ